MKWKGNCCRGPVRKYGESSPAGRLRLAVILLVTSFALPTTTAMAYVGPGAGLTMLGSAVALVMVIIVALAGLLIWPLRAMRRRKTEKQ